MTEKIDKPIYKIVAVLLFLTFAGCFMELVRIKYTGQIGYIFLIWNLFLAWIPLGLSMLIYYLYFLPRSRMKSFTVICTGALWMVFYPNTHYMITDFIHLRHINFGLLGTGYAMSYIVWYDFLMFCLLIFTGVLVGFVSLFIIHRLLRKSYNAVTTWLLVIGILFLSSFGIYLGRFIRWNTWDIMMDPGGLVQSIWSSSLNFMLAFTMMFGMFLILIYLAFYSLILLNHKLK
jgi:uncharacterized membrane protein